MPVTAEEFAVINTRNNKYHTSMRNLYPNTNGFTPEMIETIVKHAGIDRAPNNTERSQIETYNFVQNPPDKYFLYIDDKQAKATTWTGEVLGNVFFGTEWRDNFGGKRVPVTIRAINGKVYHGTYFKSSGNYARIKLSRKAA